MKRIFCLLALVVAMTHCMSSTKSGDAKIEATLRAALDRSPEQAQSLPFVTEKAADGTVIVPLFIKTNDVNATKEAIASAGGSTSTAAGNTLVARLPMTKIRSIAGRSEVIAIEPSYRERI